MTQIAIEHAKLWNSAGGGQNTFYASVSDTISERIVFDFGRPHTRDTMATDCE